MRRTHLICDMYNGGEDPGPTVCYCKGRMHLHILSRAGKIRSQLGASYPLLCASSEEAACDHKYSEDMIRGLLWGTAGLFWGDWLECSMWATWRGHWWAYWGITVYINFCVDGIVPARTVRCYPNNKPWVTKDIKAVLNQKKKASTGGHREEPRQRAECKDQRG